MLKNKRKSDLRVSIIGGGIGGLATAIALHNEGIHAEVYEQASALKEVGAGIGLRAPSMHLFKHWGIYEEIVEKSVQSDFMEVLTGKGTTIVKEQWPLLTEKSDEKWARLIHRADLLNTLISQLPPETIHLNHKCESIIEHENNVEIHFVNGDSISTDLVIAADGIHSVARSIFSNDAPVYSGYHAYRTIVDQEDTLGLIPNDNTTRIYMDDRIQIYFLPLQTRNQVSVDITAPSLDSSWVPKIEKEDITIQLKNFDSKIQQLIKNIEGSLINARALYDREPIERWSSNFITLLGDAAHAMLHNQGQGANMAIEDAGTLAEALREADTIPEALQYYESKRKPITARYQKLSRRFPSQQDETVFHEVIKSDF
ncbi:FAD-dependent monooxygenase [Bacillus thuringiensis]|uniref:FAD-dependent monooxygenase n=1 Tax=Bacillus cereus group TaxID=86661 RepID=UPI001E28FEDC|nr:FAD-dependent monooxygenase [Bacillus thuringiensis]MCU5031402.1 FAD-dependent monooxygenase [Bacillus cereus]